MLFLHFVLLTGIFAQLNEDSEQIEAPTIPVSFEVLWLNPEEGIDHIRYGNLNHLAVSVKNTADLDAKDEDDLTPVIRVTSIEASLRRFDNFRNVLQNFTNIRQSVELRPQQQATFEYLFGVVDPYTAAVKEPVGVVVTVRYGTRNRLFEEDVVNATVLFKDDYKTFDFQLVFMVLVLGVVGFLLGHSAYTWLGRKFKKRHFSGYIKKSVEPVKKTNVSFLSSSSKVGRDVDLDWISKESLKSFEEVHRRTVGNKSGEIDDYSDEVDSAHHSQSSISDEETTRKRR
ncbi:hypothetical protein ACOME3_002409 [Neoechinorhynchus agilis]